MRKTAEKLRGLPGIGVDDMGAAADAAADPEILRLENLDTDLRPPEAALEATLACIGEDNANSYLPFLGANPLRQAAASLVSRLSGVAYDWNTSTIVTVPVL